LQTDTFQQCGSTEDGGEDVGVDTITEVALQSREGVLFGRTHLFASNQLYNDEKISANAQRKENLCKMRIVAREEKKELY